MRGNRVCIYLSTLPSFCKKGSHKRRHAKSKETAPLVDSGARGSLSSNWLISGHSQGLVGFWGRWRWITVTDIATACQKQACYTINYKNQSPIKQWMTEDGCILALQNQQKAEEELPCFILAPHRKLPARFPHWIWAEVSVFLEKEEDWHPAPQITSPQGEYHQSVKCSTYI